MLFYMDKTYGIPKVNLAVLVEKIEQANKKALKLGVEPIGYELLGEYDVPAGKDLYVTHVRVRVVGQTPRIAGWTFCGTLQHLEADGGRCTLLRRAA